jgi:hypothetical protein
MRKLARFLLVRIALAMPSGSVLGPRLLGLAFGTWPRGR